MTRKALLLAALSAIVADAPGQGSSEEETTAGGIEDGVEPWSFSVSAATYLVPDDRDFFQPTLAADRGWLHLEARYNYENLDTGSVWIGYNFAGEGKVEWGVTPMLGGVFGDTTGVTPGYKGFAGWWKLELYSEGQYVFDAAESSDSFFYNWSELSLAPVEWFRIGLVTQRTRLYDSDLDTQRGVLAGFSWATASLTAYVFNPDEEDPLVVVSFAVEF